MESKERISSGKKETLIRPTSTEMEVPREIAGWLERVEKRDLYLSRPVTDDQGQVLVTSSQAKKPKIELPLSKQGLIIGLKQGVGEAVRWLAEWCLRLIKMYPRKVAFRLRGEKNQ